MITPTRLLLTVALCAGTLAVPLAGATAQESPFRLIVTHLEPPLVPNAVMDLAAEMGYFADEGVDVELVRVQQTPSALAAIQSGDGDMANISVDALLNLVAQGRNDLVAVTSPNKSIPFLIASREDIATPQDLPGHSFGIGRIGSLDHSLSTDVLEAEGIAMDDLELVTLGQPATRAQALAAGQIDATTMSIGVWTTLPDKAGLHILVDQDTYFAAAPVVDKVNIVTEQVLAERGDEVAGVIRALIKASRHFADTPGAWAEAMSAVRSDVGLEELRALDAAFAGSWSVNGGMSAEELAFTQSRIYESEDFAELPQLDLADWTDFGPVDSALEELGTREDMDPADR